VVVAEIAAAAFLFTPEAFVADERTWKQKEELVKSTCIYIAAYVAINNRKVH
jgi:hypothetical protein